MIRFVPARWLVSGLALLALSNAVFSSHSKNIRFYKKSNSVQATLPLVPTACTEGANAPVWEATTVVGTSAISAVVPPLPAGNDPDDTTLPLRGRSMSDDKPGSLLLFNIYTSDPTGAQSQDTALSITNIGSLTINTHIFLIDGKSCSVADFYASLTPSQTSRWLASEVDPGISGYALAVAVNEEGAPLSYNYLIGASRVKFNSGHAASLRAIGISALYNYNTVLPGFVAGSQTAELKLDGVQYNQAGLSVSVDNIPSPQDKNSSFLILNPVGGDLNSNNVVNTVGLLAGQLYDEYERGYSFQSSQNVCQVRQEINDSFLRVPGRFSKIIRSSSCGTIRIWETQGKYLSGAVINFNPDTATNANAFSQGHNLHNLTIADQAKYIIPVFRPHS